MRSIAIYILLLPSVMINFTISLSAQDHYTDQEIKEVAIEIITDAGVCALTTIDEMSVPRTRAMDPFHPTDDFVIWFGTNSNSRKVDQIKNNPNVSVYYITKDNSGYAVIIGLAELVDDNELKKKYWKSAWEDYYQTNKENYLLIKVIPKSLEVLSPPHGINNDPITWQPPSVQFTKE